MPGIGFCLLCFTRKNNLHVSFYSILRERGVDKLQTDLLFFYFFLLPPAPTTLHPSTKHRHQPEDTFPLMELARCRQTTPTCLSLRLREGDRCLSLLQTASALLRKPPGTRPRWQRRLRRRRLHQQQVSSSIGMAKRRTMVLCRPLPWPPSGASRRREGFLPVKAETGERGRGAAAAANLAGDGLRFRDLPCRGGPRSLPWLAEGGPGHLSRGRGLARKRRAAEQR